MKQTWEISIKNESEIISKNLVKNYVFRITFALIFGMFAPKVSKLNIGSLSSWMRYNQRVDKIENDYQDADLLSFPVHFWWNEYHWQF